MISKYFFIFTLTGGNLLSQKFCFFYVELSYTNLSFDFFIYSLCIFHIFFIYSSFIFYLLFFSVQIPAGMSAYQADWYVDEDGEGDFDEGEREDDGEEDGDGDEGVGMKDLNEDDRNLKGSGPIEMGDEIDDDDQSMMDGSIANTVTFGGNLDKQFTDGN